MRIDFRNKTFQIWLMAFIILSFVVGVSAYILESSTVPITDIKGKPLISEDCPEFKPPIVITTIKEHKSPITQIANYVKVPDPVEYGKANQVPLPGDQTINSDDTELPETVNSQAKVITKVVYVKTNGKHMGHLERLRGTKNVADVESYSTYKMHTWIPDRTDNKKNKGHKKDSRKYDQLQSDIDDLASGFNTSAVEKQRETRKRYYAEAMKSSENVYLKSCRIQPPKFSLPVGTIIKCKLLSAINTENPGNWIVNAKVTKPVYGGTRVGESWLAIPSETKIILSYSFEINYGNHSVPATANMLIFPDESFMEIPGFPAVEISGTVGLSGKVNNRWPRIITVAGITSFLGYIPMKIAESWEEDSASRHVALGVSKGMNQAGNRLLNREIVPPTLNIKENKEFGVYCNKIMIFEEPYEN
ncbi:MAG: type IV secretion system protein VirB10 [Candidatus Magnetoglobus multicellularis str. Araruama]|uniref:Type IV secretion system protein VirB10 n=1 Tax=Candidatus Magnetoglobus multicellularis str. Araruama TaxID=890399 RepID=A0A1V1PA08_9BACT|nr:MAG: type IV secretion system protein VirB10 [Candidatus Magnetoglobus multicellularis str. Araruama]